MSPALAGGFLTTAPPGKSSSLFSALSHFCLIPYKKYLQAYKDPYTCITYLSFGICAHVTYTRADVVLLCFALLRFTERALFYKSKVCGNRLSSQSVVTAFSYSICSLCVFVSHFVNSCNVSNPPPAKIYNSLRAEMTVSIF